MDKEFLMKFKRKRNAPLAVEKLAIQNFDFIEGRALLLCDELKISDRAAAISAAQLAFHEAADSHEKGNFLVHASGHIAQKLKELAQKLNDGAFSKVTLHSDQEMVAEIRDLGSALDKFNLGYVDAALTCPSSGADMELCAAVVASMMADTALFNDFLYKRNDFLKRLSKAASASEKFLKKHRSYVMAVLFMRAGDFPAMQEHMDPAALEKGFLIVSNYESFSIVLGRDGRFLIAANMNCRIADTVAEVIVKQPAAKRAFFPRAAYLMSGAFLVLLAAVALVALAANKGKTPVPSGPAAVESSPAVSASAEASTPTPSPSPTPTPTPTPSPSPTLTPTPSPSPTLTPTPTPTPTPSPTLTPTPTLKPTPSPTPTPSPSLSPMPSASPKPSPSASAQASATPKRTASSSAKSFFVQTSGGELSIAATVKSSDAQTMFELVNAERKKAGVAGLSYDSSMDQAAQQRAAEISVDMSHTRPNGLAWYFVSDKAAAENIAFGQSSASSAVRALMGSESDKANILNGEYTRISIACLEIGGEKHWVQLFGK